MWALVVACRATHINDHNIIHPTVVLHGTRLNNCLFNTTWIKFVSNLLNSNIYHNKNNNLIIPLEI